MDILPVSPPAAALPDQATSALSASDEAALFDQMVQGTLMSGLSLMNTVVGDAIDAIAEPFGDPDQ